MKLLERGEAIVAVGLMSGTSLDGIDAALIETDGLEVVSAGPTLSVPYSKTFRDRLKDAVEKAGRLDAPSKDGELERDITDLHIEAVSKLLEDRSGETKWSQPHIIGFHGHTILHRPNRGYTQQIGDATRLASYTNLPVVSGLREQDVNAGGQGAPLVPIFHSALGGSQDKPVCFVNIGGIANITWIGAGQNELVAFDTGTGNGLLDAWVEQNTGKRFDKGGALAAKGRANSDVLEALLDHPFFSEPFPKSLDRSDFNLDLLSDLSLEDGAATLVSFTADSIVRGLELCPSPPLSLYVSGGGRHNNTLMKALEAHSPCPVQKVEKNGWDGDFIEAQAFAFLATRTCLDLPITFPNTTGITAPMAGGTITYPGKAKT